MYLNIRKIIEEIKFYLPIIFILPPILGGIWQLVELFRIDPSYIRFFSATQLLPDGLLMLLILIATTPLLFIILILHKVIPKILDNKEKIKITTQSNLKHFYILKNTQKELKYKTECNNELSFGGLLALTFLTIIFFAVLYITIKEGEITLFPFLTTIFFSFFSLSMTILAYVESFNCSEINLLKKLKKNDALSKLSTVIYFIIVLFIDLFIIVFIPLIIVLSIHQVYLFPYNLLNAKKIDISKLLYINDKYIFIEHLDKNESKSIQIMKFDVLFYETKK